MNLTFHTSLFPPYVYLLDSSSGQRLHFAFQSISVLLCIQLLNQLAGVLLPIHLQLYVMFGCFSPIITQ